MTMNTIRHQYGYLLPNLHSDWLTLAVMAGGGVALGAAWLWARVVFASPASRWAAACQASLLGVGVLSAVQGTVCHARIAGAVVVLLAWWVAEQREGRVHA